MSVYSRIKTLSKKKKISINKLEKELDLSRGSLCKIDTNTPSASRLEMIADYFGVSVDYLMGRDEESDPSPIQLYFPSDKAAEIAGQFERLNDENKIMIENLMSQLLQAQEVRQEQSARSLTDLINEARAEQKPYTPTSRTQDRNR